jgi:hypothetical protein
MLAIRLLLDAVHWRRGKLHESFHRCRSLLRILCRDLRRRLDFLNPPCVPSMGLADGQEGEGLSHSDSCCRRAVSHVASGTRNFAED